MKLMNNILVSGCSFANNTAWTTAIWPNSTVNNVARSGASNNYISDSIINNIDLKNKPDFVFILWSGLNKLDISLPKSSVVKHLVGKWEFFGETKNSYYLFDGGDKINYILEQQYNNIKEPNWPAVKNLLDFWNLDSATRQECMNHKILQEFNINQNDLQDYLYTAFMLYRLYNNSQFFNNVSLSAIANCCTFLEYHQIPYKFSFACDVFANHSDSALLKGKIDKTNLHFSRINWEKYVKLTPYEFGLKHDLISDDGLHLTNLGMTQWATELTRHL
jgi:hypothetical protein